MWTQQEAMEVVCPVTHRSRIQIERKIEDIEESLRRIEEWIREDEEKFL